MKKEVMSSALVKLAVNDLELLQSMSHQQSPQKTSINQSRPSTTAQAAKPQSKLKKENSSVSITRPGTAAIKINPVGAAVERAVTRKIS